MSKVTAQIAVEAIVNDPESYPDLATVGAIVLADAEQAGVSEFYLSMLREVLDNA